MMLVLNARSARGSAERFWDLPGGASRAGETLREALAREWEEEVGWKPAVGDLLMVADGAKRHATDASPIYTWRAFVFDVPEPPFGSMPTPGPEIEKIEFVRTADALLRLSAPYHGPLRAFLADGPRYATVSWIEPIEPDGEGLPAETRRLCVLAAAAAVGDTALVATETKAALEAGVLAPRIEETLLQIVPYAGYPRALSAFLAARPILGPATPAAETSPRVDLAAEGTSVFEAVYGESAERVLRGLASLHPALPAWTIENAYGRVLSRPALPLATRELLAVSILTALGGCDDALLGHMRAAVRLGASSDRVAGAVAVVPSSVGDGKRAAARAVLGRLSPP